MEDIKALRARHRWEVLQKEMGFIQETIKNLDDIIYKTKSFAFALWGGSLSLIFAQLKAANGTLPSNLMALTALIPVFFWMMDYRWRKYLMQCGQRERHISLFVNSEAFEHLILKGEKDLNGKQFPLFDVVGWIYTKSTYNQPDGSYFQEYLLDENEFKGLKVALYKDAKWFYGMMVIVSIVLALLFL